MSRPANAVVLRGACGASSGPQQHAAVYVYGFASAARRALHDASASGPAPEWLMAGWTFCSGGANAVFFCRFPKYSPQICYGDTSSPGTSTCLEGVSLIIESRKNWRAHSTPVSTTKLLFVLTSDVLTLDHGSRVTGVQLQSTTYNSTTTSSPRQEKFFLASICHANTDPPVTKIRLWASFGV